jgi:hypothetical protein
MRILQPIRTCLCSSCQPGADGQTSFPRRWICSFQILWRQTRDHCSRRRVSSTPIGCGWQRGPVVGAVLPPHCRRSLSRGDIIAATEGTAIPCRSIHPQSVSP